MINSRVDDFYFFLSKHLFLISSDLITFDIEIIPCRDNLEIKLKNLRKNTLFT